MRYTKILKKRRFYVMSISLLLFLILAILVLKHDYLEIDIYGYNFISSNIISDKITPIIKILTNFGGGLFLILLAIFSYKFIKDKRFFYGIIINLSMSISLNLFLKLLLQRNRPVTNRIINEIGYSFPSGHSMVSMAFYGFIIYLVYVYCNNKKIKWPVILFLICIILIIGLSRVYLGVHYLSDVLAGFCFSLAYLIVYIYFFNKYLWKTKSINAVK